MQVPSRGQRVSVLHRYGPVLPAKVFRHVPRPEAEIPPDHLIDVSGPKVLALVFQCSFLLPFPPVLLPNAGLPFSILSLLWSHSSSFESAYSISVGVIDAAIPAFSAAASGLLLLFPLWAWQLQ